MSKRWNQAIQDRDEQRLMKRQAVLTIGARLFHERGFDRTSLDDIAKALGVTKPSLYYYVKNKDEILFEIISISLEFTSKAFALAKGQGRTGLDRILIFFREYAVHLHSDFGRCAARVEINALDDKFKDRIVEARKAIDAEVRALVSEGRQDGSIAPLDARWVTFFLFGAFNWIAHWRRSSGPATPEEVADAYVALARKTLSPQ